MSYAIVYSSKTGNTKILADTLHDCLPQEGCDYFGFPDPAAMIKELQELGVETMVSIWPAVDFRSENYEEMKKQPIHLPNLDAMIENFDKALSHPDADDLEQLKQAVR